MAQNFLYMFEFVVDDLLVTRPNKCAPEEYPTCCEISFRSSVFVAICDREYGYCVDTCAPKCGKCCLFSLESPITDKDRLLIHVYKKKDNNCKFLLGAADMKIKPLFDKVTTSFDIENPNWIEMVTHHNACLPDPKLAVRRGGATQTQHRRPEYCDACDVEGRKESFCPTSEMSKNLLPLFSMKGEQTGNLMLITRLVCNGPTIVSTFPFSKFCQANCCSPCDNKKKSKSRAPKVCSSDTSAKSVNAGGPCQMRNPCKNNKEEDQLQCRHYFKCNDDDQCSCNECADYNDYECGMASKPNSSARKSKSHCGSPRGAAGCEDRNGSKLKKQKGKYGSSPCVMPDPCVKPDEKEAFCSRYFACNADKGCPCNKCEDEFDRTCPQICKPRNAKRKSRKVVCPPPRQTGGECCCEPKKRKPAASDDQCGFCKSGGSTDSLSAQCNDFDDDASSASGSCCMSPCFMQPTRPEPGPEAYEEFEACLNGSGLTVRVLKDTHKMESVYDGTEVNMDDSDNECCDPALNNCGKTSNNCATLEEILNSSNIARKALQRRTAGHIVNHPSIPKVRANIKYAGADTGCLENYKLPFTKFKEHCKAVNKLDEYRKRADDCYCGPIEPPRHLDNTRNCCMQVDPTDITNLLKGVNIDSRKKGIEVCYKTCDDNESDVFLVKLGAKKSCERKQHSVEIELKTPKIPVSNPVQRCTTETQIAEGELDAALRGICGKKGKGKKGKGKKGKK